MNLQHAATRKAYGMAIDGVLKYVNKDRQKNLLKIVDISEKFLGDRFRREIYDGARELIRDEDGKWMQFLYKALDELNPNVVKMNALNMGFEAGFSGFRKAQETGKEHDCNVPWIILMDPTSACNLHCTGCWAAEYGRQMNLSYEELDSIIT